MVFEREGWVIIAPIIAYKVLHGYENTLTNLDTALKNLHTSYLKHLQRSGGTTNKKNKEIREMFYNPNPKTALNTIKDLNQEIRKSNGPISEIINKRRENNNKKEETKIT